MQWDLKHRFTKMMEGRPWDLAGCILNLDLMSYRRVISPQNYQIYDFQEKWYPHLHGKNWQCISPSEGVASVRASNKYDGVFAPQNYCARHPFSLRLSPSAHFARMRCTFCAPLIASR